MAGPGDRLLFLGGYALHRLARRYAARVRLGRRQVPRDAAANWPAGGRWQDARETDGASIETTCITRARDEEPVTALIARRTGWTRTCQRKSAPPSPTYPRQSRRLKDIGQAAALAKVEHRTRWKRSRSTCRSWLRPSPPTRDHAAARHRLRQPVPARQVTGEPFCCARRCQLWDKRIDFSPVAGASRCCWRPHRRHPLCATRRRHPTTRARVFERSIPDRQTQPRAPAAALRRSGGAHGAKVSCGSDEAS